MKRVLVLGSRSLVALPLCVQLLSKQVQVIAVSRQPEALSVLQSKGCEVIKLDKLRQQKLELDALISLMPIWETANLISKLKLSQLRKAVVVSSSSVVNKKQSNSASDIALVERLERAEASLKKTFDQQNLDLIILRPTMVFGYGKDKNISLILRNLQRFHVMPFLGKAKGLRQPMHADDLAKAICLSLEADLGSQTFELGGATQLTYRDMVAEIARAYDVNYLSLTLPKLLLLSALNMLKNIPRYRFIEISMFERMNQDLIIDNHLLERHISYNPISFQEALTKELNA